MSAAIPWYGPADVHRALPWPKLVAALREAFRAGAEVPLRHVHAVRPEENGYLLLMPAWRAGGATGVKLVTVYPGNRARGMASVSALYMLLDGDTGHPRALLDGEALTLRRTAAASALASTCLSRPDSAMLLVIGAGTLAPWMVRAHCSVRPIRRVEVWARRTDAAAALAGELRRDGLDAAVTVDPAAAAQRADILVCATTATEPVLRGAWLAPGAHVDLVGAFTPAMREADDALIARASVFVDTRRGALAEAGDLVQAIAAGRFHPDRVCAELAELCTGAHPGRAARDEITVFKSVGTALEDLCAAETVVGVARPDAG